MPARTSEPFGRPDPSTIDPDELRLERYRDNAARTAKMRAYYAVKPLLPRKLQIALRRAYAVRQARVAFPSWPIEPILVEHRDAQLRDAIQAAGGRPVPLIADWPEAHRFAAILTHDVEGPAGVDNVLRLIELERRHGLVSSWNFVAEWYPIPSALFDKVRDAGCEIGLHGIKHDGKLFADRDAFVSNLPAIHRYLTAWGAVGFRSPATHRDSAWMPELGCLYDSSFPDTDPFEPQPGGCCSILPFLIDQLVELPITLVQDHTMWEILRDDSIDLWTRKSDWIISHGGLINVIVHPDYVLSEERLRSYDRFCAYLRERLDRDDGWHALPCEVASWWKVRSSLYVEGAPDDLRIGGSGSRLTRRARIEFAHERDGELVIER